jgi:hypothetical protein
MAQEGVSFSAWLQRGKELQLSVIKGLCEMLQKEPTE